MIKTKIAAAVMLAACASAPTVAGATTPSHHKKAQAHAATGTHSKSGKSSAHAAVHGKSAAKSAAHGRHGSVAKAAHAAPVAAAVALTHVQSAPVRRQDKSFDLLSNQFLTALWREDPEAAIEVGKYDTAANLTIPDKAHQAAELAFIAESLDLILNTDYAAKPQRLRTLLKRIAGVPAYYDAARANIVKPTREHTQLAIAQAPGVQAM